MDIQQRLAGVDPQRVIKLLRGAGWVEAGGRSGAYTRLLWPPSMGDPRTLLILTDTSAPEYRDLMGAALTELATVARVGRRCREVLDALGDPLASFRTDDPERARNGI